MLMSMLKMSLRNTILPMKLLKKTKRRDSSLIKIILQRSMKITIALILRRRCLAYTASLHPTRLNSAVVRKNNWSTKTNHKKCSVITLRKKIWVWILAIIKMRDMSLINNRFSTCARTRVSPT